MADKMAPGNHPIRACADCGRERPIAGRGMCGTCYAKVHPPKRRYDHPSQAWRLNPEPNAWTGWVAAVPLPQSERERLYPVLNTDDLEWFDLIEWHHGQDRRSVPIVCDHCKHTLLSHRVRGSLAGFSWVCAVATWTPSDPIPCGCKGESRHLKQVFGSAWGPVH